MKYFFSIIIYISLFLSLGLNLKAQETEVDKLINEQKYEKAIGVILDDGTIETLSVTNLENLGYCYVMTNRYRDAEIVYSKLISEPSSSIENYKYYAEILIVGGKYNDAKSYFQKYLEKNPDDVQAKIRMASCDSLFNWRYLEPRYIVGNFDEICTKYNEIACTMSDNDVLYLSNRRLKDEEEFVPRNEIPDLYVFDTHQSMATKEYITDKYWCSSLVYDSISKRYAYSLRLIVENIDGFTLAKSKIMFEDKSNNSIDGLTLFTWEGMPENANIAHPAFANNGTRLFFTSDMVDGYGGMDIYYSDFENGVWTDPKNAGSSVNTAFDDLAPVIADSGLYYSTSGLPGYGNHDIYFSRIDGNKFSKSVNLKAPINSYGDDLFLVPYKENKYVVSSNRSTLGKGGFDVHFVTKLKEIKPVVENPDDTIVVNKLNIASFKTPKIFFEIDKYFIYDEYKEGLKSFADTLILYSDISVNILGYTDETGTEEINAELSNLRAKSVADQLIEYGVPSSRISYDGKGVKKDVTMDGFRYHVVIGTIRNDQEAEWYNQEIDNKYDITVMPFKKFYCYCIGDFDNSSDAEEMSRKIAEEFDIDCYITSSYLGRCLAKYELAINRRVDFILYRDNGE